MVYSFAGDVHAPKLLWELPFTNCGTGASTTILDAIGDGRSEVLFGRQDGYELLDGVTAIGGEPRTRGTTVAACDRPPS